MNCLLTAFLLAVSMCAFAQETPSAESRPNVTVAGRAPGKVVTHSGTWVPVTPPPGVTKFQLFAAIGDRIWISATDGSGLWYAPLSCTANPKWTATVLPRALNTTELKVSPARAFGLTPDGHVVVTFGRNTKQEKFGRYNEKQNSWDLWSNDILAHNGNQAKGFASDGKTIAMTTGLFEGAIFTSSDNGRTWQVPHAGVGTGGTFANVYNYSKTSSNGCSAKGCPNSTEGGATWFITYDPYRNSWFTGGEGEYLEFSHDFMTLVGQWFPGPHNDPPGSYGGNSYAVAAGPNELLFSKGLSGAGGVFRYDRKERTTTRTLSYTNGVPQIILYAPLESSGATQVYYAQNPTRPDLMHRSTDGGRTWAVYTGDLSPGQTYGSLSIGQDGSLWAARGGGTAPGPICMQ